MSQSAQPRTVQSADHGSFNIRGYILLAILLAAGFILNMFVGKAIGALTGNMIQPEFIISAFCLTILVIRPGILEALVIGLISAAVIQLTTSSPFIDFAAEGVAAMLMAAMVLGARGKVSAPFAGISTFVTTAVSGIIFMAIKMVLLGAEAVMPLLTGMLPVVLLTAVFNGVLVAALYLPIKGALGSVDFGGKDNSSRYE